MNQQTIYSITSSYQSIELIKDSSGLMLALNGSPQVHSAEEKQYHEACVTLPMMLAKNAKKVLILGGGDGLALRNVLQFKEVESVTLVELDQKVLDVCSTHLEWIKISNGSLTDPRAKVITGDAYKFMIETEETYDVIIHDLEAVWTEKEKELSVDVQLAFYEAIKQKLNPGGVWSLTTSDDDEEGDFVKELFQLARSRKYFTLKTLFRFLIARDWIQQIQVLLDSKFKFSKKWVLNFPALGPHAIFYISNDRFDSYKRFPDQPTQYVAQCTF